MLWNKSKQMGSMREVAWHQSTEEGRLMQPTNTLLTLVALPERQVAACKLSTGLLTTALPHTHKSRMCVCYSDWYTIVVDRATERPPGRTEEAYIVKLNNMYCGFTAQIFRNQWNISHLFKLFYFHH